MSKTNPKPAPKPWSCCSPSTAGCQCYTTTSRGTGKSEAQNEVSRRGQHQFCRFLPSLHTPRQHVDACGALWMPGVGGISMKCTSPLSLFRVEKSPKQPSSFCNASLATTAQSSQPQFIFCRNKSFWVQGQMCRGENLDLKQGEIELQLYGVINIYCNVNQRTELLI